MVKKISISTPGRGLHEISEEVRQVVRDADIDDGILNLHIMHTSASLLIQENADPSARRDLEHWLTRLVPENDSLFTHTAEGPDDMPSHIRSMLTASSLSIPIMNGEMMLGTWQGIYLFEHRRHPHTRSIAIHIGN